MNAPQILGHQFQRDRKQMTFAKFYQQKKNQYISKYLNKPHVLALSLHSKDYHDLTSFQTVKKKLLAENFDYPSRTEGKLRAGWMHTPTTSLLTALSLRHSLICNEY